MKGVVQIMLALDHIIIPTTSPPQVANKFAKKHSVYVIKGGHHERWGTYNYLTYFNNHTYLEWIGIDQMDIAEKSDNPLIQQVVHALKNGIEQPIQYALRTNQLRQYIVHFDVCNIPYKGPFKGNRGRPDGSLLEWQMLFPICPTGYSLPFLIQWGKKQNVPTDKNTINDRALASVTDYRPNIDSFKKTFHLPRRSHDEPINLTNSQLSLRDGDKLTFTLATEQRSSL